VQNFPEQPERHRTHRATTASATQASTRGTRSTEAGIREPQGGALSVLPYLLVLAAVGVGVFVAFLGGRNTAKGAGIAGTVLLLAGLLRLALPPRYAGPLASRSKTIDVLAFLLLGGGVLGLAIWVP
jgi:Protein of unknown function (DUF3017)